MQPKITATITCVKCGGTLTGSENSFTIACPFCGTEYTVSIAAAVAEPTDIDERIGRLLACVLDGNPRERDEAVIDLSKIRDARLVMPVIAAMKRLQQRIDQSGAYEELNPFYFALNKIIMYIGIPEAVEPLVACLRDDDDSIRGLAAIALREAVAPAAVEPLIAAAKDPDSSVRSSAVLALGSYSDERIPGVLMAALNDQSPRVIEAALRSLCKLRCAEATAQIIAIFNTRTERYEDHTSWDDVRKVAAWALTDIRNDAAVKTLVEAADDEDPKVREWVRQGLESVCYTIKDAAMKQRIEGILKKA